MYRGEGVCRKGGVLVPDTGRKCGRKKRKTSEGWKDKQGRDKEQRREEGENVDWPQIESHPFITPGLVRLATLLPFPLLFPGSLASRTKIGDEEPLPPCPFIGRRFAGRGEW